MGSSSSPSAAAQGPFRLRKGQAPRLQDVAELIKRGAVKNAIIMAGAGISTSAGIPDFRSPETGLYANLEKYDLPYPEAIFDIEYFVEKPEAFYTLSKELYPGNFHPTLTHYFFRLLKDKGLLKSVFTQNIDTLERMAGLDDETVIEAHGSFAEAECLACEKTYTKESIKPQIQLGQVVRCTATTCINKSSALVKPKIVFFGEGLPAKFFSRLTDFASCDLLIVLGTSLSVQPFASLIHRVPKNCPRVLINLESVGEIEAPRSRFFGSGSQQGFDFEGVTGNPIRDVRFLGTSDEGVKELSQALGWESELLAMYEKGKELFAKENPTHQPVASKRADEPNEAISATADVQEERAQEKQAEIISVVTESLEKRSESDDEEIQVAELEKGIWGVTINEKKPKEATTDSKSAPAAPPKSSL